MPFDFAFRTCVDFPIWASNDTDGSSLQKMFALPYYLGREENKPSHIKKRCAISRTAQWGSYLGALTVVLLVAGLFDPKSITFLKAT